MNGRRRQKELPPALFSRKCPASLRPGSFSETHKIKRFTLHEKSGERSRQCGVTLMRDSPCSSHPSDAQSRTLGTARVPRRGNAFSPGEATKCAAGKPQTPFPPRQDWETHQAVIYLA